MAAGAAAITAAAGAERVLEFRRAWDPRDDEDTDACSELGGGGGAGHHRCRPGGDEPPGSPGGGEEGARLRRLLDDMRAHGDEISREQIDDLLNELHRVVGEGEAVEAGDDAGDFEGGGGGQAASLAASARATRNVPQHILVTLDLPSDGDENFF